MSWWKQWFQRLRHRFPRVGRKDLTRWEEWKEQLEEWLVTADLPLDLVDILLENLENHRKQFSSLTQAIYHLRKILREQLQQATASSSTHIPTFQEEEEVRKSAELPRVILISGVNGSGKTTTCARLARRFQKLGVNHILLVPADTFRAGAIEQLAIWGERLGVSVAPASYGEDPGAVVYRAWDLARTHRMKLMIVDTGGRIHTRKDLMEQLGKIYRVLQRRDPQAPHHSFLVMDASTGQNGVPQAQVFARFVHPTGVIATRLDGTARGGVLAGILWHLHLPVVYVGTGETPDDLIPFDLEEYIRHLIPEPPHEQEPHD